MTHAPAARTAVIPPEIQTFFRLPGRSLLVRGRAGGGKTLFALELARWHQLELGDVLWVNSREADAVAAAELEKVVPSQQQLHVADAATPVEAAVEASLPDLASVLGVLEDVAEAARDAERPLVIVDSLDGITEGLPGSERALVVRAAVHLARSLRISLVLVRERAEGDAADYLVDGAVSLGERHADDARMRELRIEKLRGTPIRRSTYAFTLAEGRFRAAVPAAKEAPPTALRPAPRADVPGRISTGTPAWDDLLGGGLARGSVLLLELGTDLGPLLETLLAPLLVNHLNLGRGATVLTPPDLARASLERWALPHVAARRDAAPPLRGLEGGALSAPSRFGDRGASLDERLTPLEVARDAQRAHGPVLSVLSVDALVSAFPAEAVDGWLAAWALSTRERGDVDVLLASKRSVTVAESVADSRWHLDVAHGAPLLRGRVPQTGPYFVDFQRDRGFPEANLVPVQ